MASLRLRKKTARHPRLRLENLEDRAVPAAAGFDAGAGRLTLTGDDGNNTARVEVAGGFVRLTLDGQTLSANPKAADYAPELAGVTGSALTAIEFAGGAGWDRLVIGDLRVGGALAVTGDDEVEVTGKVAAAGPVALTSGNRIVVVPTGAVRSQAGRDGGSVSLTAPVVSLGGRLRADGVHGGQVHVAATNLLNFGTTTADGTAGGGAVELTATGRYLETTAAVVRASGGSGAGGRITIDAGPAGTVFASGRHLATGRTGGTVDVFGKDLRLTGALVDVSGRAGGGAIRVGGDFHGANPDVSNAATTAVAAGTVLRANALGSGAGGTVVVWADGTTDFHGRVSARGVSAGGSIEVSGKGDLTYGGTADAGATAGANGTLLLDPKNLVISAAAAFPQFSIPDPNPNNGGSFAGTVRALPNGNVIVGDPGDDFAATNAGAVYLFHGTTGALISTLTGYAAGDGMGGSGSVQVLPVNGNFVVLMPYADLFGYTDLGAATWGSKTTGVSGPIGSGNSALGTSDFDYFGYTFRALTNGNFVVGSPYYDFGAVDTGLARFCSGTTATSGYGYYSPSIRGTKANDYVGYGGIVALANGNYVVVSPYWDNGAVVEAGAVTWGDGATGTTGTVTAGNSLVGSTAYDYVGFGGVTALPVNGNYVVVSPYWDNGPAYLDAGAVKLGSGTGGTVGTINSGNALVGNYSYDSLGSYGVVALPSGNFVVRSPYADAGSFVAGNTGSIPNVGAFTWASGTAGLAGNLSTSNSYKGGAANDYVGIAAVTVLTNGNYVVASPYADNGGFVDAGGVTWGNGTAARVGTIGTGTSLMGARNNDNVGNGGVVALTNGNYVVSSPYWDNGGVTEAGAVTWGNGATGTTGTVTAGNSLVGSSTSDFVGSPGVTALTNGNYAVASSSWNNGGVADAGAVTWGNGAGGTVGPVTAGNSLVGSSASDYIGSGGVVALPVNGNYVVCSPYFDESGVSEKGAIKLASGTGGTVGTMTSGNALVGSYSYDYVGFNGAVALPSGNFVVRSPGADNGGVVDAGAVTWGSGTAGPTGYLGAGNSLMGSSTSDQLGYGVTVLASGNYLVTSPYWDNGAAVDAGAATWVSGTAGVTGTVTAANSVVGLTSNAGLGFAADNPANGTFLVPFGTAGRVVVGIPDLAGLTYALGAGADVGVSPVRLATVLNAGTNLVLQASNDITVNSPIVVNNPSGNGGSLTLQAGRSIYLNASITTDGGNLTLIGNDLLAGGVIDDQRDAGVAVIDLAPGVTIDAGAGNVVVDLRSGAGKTYTAAGDVTIGGIITTGNLTVTSPEGITDVRQLSVGGVTSLTAGTDVRLDEPFNDFATVTVPAAKNLVLTDGTAINLGICTAFGGATIRASGTVTQTGRLIVVGPAAIESTTGALINLPLANNGFFGTVGLATDGSAVLTASSNVMLGDLTVGGSLTVSSGGPLGDAGTVAVLGTTNLIAAGIPVTLDSAGNNFVGAVTTTGATVLTLVDINGLVLGGQSVNKLTVTAGGQVSATGPLSVATTTSLTAGSVALDTAANDFVGDVTVSTTGNLALRDANALSLGTSSVAGNLTVLAGGAVLQSGSLAVTGTTGVSAGSAGISLFNGSNDFGGAVGLTTAGPGSVRDANALTLGAMSVGGTLNVLAGTGLTVAAPLTAQNTVSLSAATVTFTADLTTGSQPVTLTSGGGNSVNLGPTTTVSAGGSLTAANGVTVGNGETLAGGGAVDVGTGGAGLTVQSGGTLDPVGTLSVDGDVALAAGSVLKVAVNGTGAAQFDRLAVIGGVALNGATLGLSVGYTPALTDAMTIVTNDGGDAIGGKFDQQHIVIAGGAKWQVNYAAPDGNDLKLTAGEVGLNNNAPTLSNVPVSANLNEGSLLSFTATANDIDFGQTLTFSLAGAPAGAAINPTTGAFSWTPIEVQGPDTYVFDVRVSDGTATTGQSITVVVGEVNVSPVLAGVPATRSVDRGNVLAFTALATDADLVHGVGNARTFSLVGAPAGASIHPDTGSFTWSTAANLALGNYTFTVRVTDDGVPALADNKSITVTVTGNTAPILSGVQGFAQVDEGSALTFTATVTDPDPQSRTFSLVGAPAGAGINPTTGAFSWTPTEAQGPGTFAFAVRVSDGTATDDEPITVQVGEVNQSPVLAGVPTTLTTAPGSPVAFTATATDDDRINGLGNALTFSLIGAPAGASIDPDTGAFAWTPGDADPPGDYSFKVRVVDDGVPARSITQNLKVTVTAAGLVNGDLLIGGTAGNDTIVVTPSKDLSQLVVTMNKSVLGSFPVGSVTGRIVVHGLNGADKVTVNAKVVTPTDLYGDAGADALTGGSGDDRLFGGAGNDKLAGGKGNDLLDGGAGDDKLSDVDGFNVLIGGAGSDKLTGGKGDDLLIAGSIDAAANLADLTGLTNIMTEWTKPITTTTYAQKVANLTVGVGAEGTKLTAATVHDDSARDVLTGGKGQDWFLTSANAAFPDRTDVKAGEMLTMV